MQIKHTPVVDLHYWAAITLASVFGANLGDAVSRYLHLGHWRGLAPLALMLGGILLLERRSKRATVAWYWLAIVIVRTAATNLADLATHDLQLDYGLVVAGLAFLLAGVLLLDRTLLREADQGLPSTSGGGYWVAMLTAGTLGTASGDALADDWGLGVGPATVLLGVVLAGAFFVRASVAASAAVSYWITIVVIRTFGTTLGDLAAHTIGLASSTLLSGLLFVGTLILARDRLTPQTRPTEPHAQV